MKLRKAGEKALKHKNVLFFILAVCFDPSITRKIAIKALRFIDYVKKIFSFLDKCVKPFLHSE